MSLKTTWVHKIINEEDSLLAKYTYTQLPMNGFDFWKCNVKPNDMCQVFDSCVRSTNYALLTITELPNNELTSIHTLSLPPLLL